MRNPPARVDSNQPEIVAALRKAGCSVQHLHMVGAGCPDLLVGYEGVNYLMEVKTPNGVCTQSECDWIDEWNGDSRIVRSAKQALDYIGATEEQP